MKKGTIATGIAGVGAAIAAFFGGRVSAPEPPPEVYTVDEDGVQIRWHPDAVRQMMELGCSLEMIILAANLEAITGKLIDPMALETTLRIGDRLFTDEILQYVASRSLLQEPENAGRDEEDREENTDR